MRDLDTNQTTCSSISYMTHCLILSLCDFMAIPPIHSTDRMDGNPEIGRQREGGGGGGGEIFACQTLFSGP